MMDWLQQNEAAAGWLLASSAAMFVVTLVAVPWLAVKIPADYFAERKRKRQWLKHYNPHVRMLLLILRNLLGLIFALGGFMMLVLPGQGILSIVVGLCLMTFPGKRQLLRWFVTLRPVCAAINSIRRRAGVQPLVVVRSD